MFNSVKKFLSKNITLKKKICLILSVILIALSMMFYVYSNKNKSIISFKSDKDLIVEYGEKIEKGFDKYLKVENYKNEDQIKEVKENTKIEYNFKNEKDKEYPAVGEYNIIFNYKDQKLTKNIIVKDTKAPTFNDADEIKVQEGTNIDFNSYIKSEDLSGIKELTFNTEGLDTNKPGEYIIKANAKDNNGNITLKDIKVVIEAKPQEPQETQESHNSNSNNSNSSKTNNSNKTSNNSNNSSSNNSSSNNSSVDYVANYSFESNTSYIIDVKSSGNYGTLSVHTKDNGTWSQMFSTSCRVGRHSRIHH